MQNTLKKQTKQSRFDYDIRSDAWNDRVDLFGLTAKILSYLDMLMLDIYITTLLILYILSYYRLYLS